MDSSTPSFYIAIPQHVLYNVQISPTAKLLYGVIDSFQLSTGTCYASNERLAQEMANCSDRTVSRCIAELKDAGLITIETGKTAKGKQPCRRITLSTVRGQGVDKNGDHPTTKLSTPPRQNCLPPLAKNGDIVTKKSKTEKKRIDPLSIFVSWIKEKIGDSASADDKNQLYFCLKDYAEMRNDTKSPLNTKRKVDGLLEDLWEKSGGILPVMCDMVVTAKRRCWLSVHAPGGDAPANSAPTQGRRYEEL